MVYRLVFNVLTVPTIEISDRSSAGIPDKRKMAEETLFTAFQEYSGGLKDEENFVQMAMTDGLREGEGYLGYKDRPDVTENLRRMFTAHKSRVPPVEGVADIFSSVGFKGRERNLEGKV
jgi:hypothetical protein